MGVVGGGVEVRGGECDGDVLSLDGIGMDCLAFG